MRGRAWRRRLALVLALPLGVLTGALLLAAGLLARLAAGPVSLDPLAPRLEHWLEASLAEGVDAKVGGAVLESVGGRPSVRLVDVTLDDANGAEILSSRKVELGLNPLWWRRAGSPLRAVRFIAPRLALRIDADGLSWPGMAEGGDGPGPDARAAPDPAAAAPRATPPHPLAAVLDLVEGRRRTGGLRAIAIEDGRIAVQDGQGQIRLDVAEVQGALVLDGAGRGRLELAAVSRLPGRTAPHSWSARVGVEPSSGSPEGARRVRVALGQLSLDHLAALGAPPLAPVLAGASLGGEADLTLAPDGRVLSGRGRLEARLAPGGPGPAGDAEATLAFSPQGVLDVEEARGTVDGATLRLRGRIARDASSGAWQGAILGASGELPPGRPGDPRLRVDELAAEATVPADLSRLDLTHLEARGPEFGVALTGSFGAPSSPVALKLGLGGANASAAAALALWPAPVAPKLRAWVARRVLGGRVERLALGVSLSQSDLVEAIADRPIPPSSVSVELDISDATLRYEDALPPLVDGQARLRGDGRSVAVDIPTAAVELGGGNRLDLSDGRFNVADASLPRPIAQVGLRVRGTLESALDLLGRPFLRPLVRLGEVGAARGMVDAVLDLAVPLEEKAGPGGVKAVARGTISRLSLDRVLGREGLDAGEIAFTSEAGALTARGEVRLAGVPLTLEARRPDPGSPAEVKLTGVLDEAARARRGLPVAPVLSGPLGLRATTRLAEGRPPVVAVELDLARTGIELPGIEAGKPAGRPGRAGFTARAEGDGLAIDDLVVAAGDVQAAGQVRLGPDGSLRGAELSGVRIPGGEVAVTAERGREAIRLAVRGGNLDARPLLKKLLAGSRGPSAGGAGAAAPDVDLDLRLASATGHGGEAISGLEVRASRRGGALQGFSLAGRFGRAPVSGVIARDESGGRSLVLESADGGAFLRFADVYRRMVGGALTLRVAAEEARPDGLLVVQDFRLRDEPALAGIASSGAAPPPAEDERARGQAAPAAPARSDGVSFTRMRVDFLRRPGRFDIKDAVMWGPQVGASVSGSLDLAKDRADLVGTFVPAYALNNVFSQIPVLGYVLGGGRNEGLFAVSFKVTGSIGKPDVSISPLSAIAPGILRKLFEFRKETGAGAASVPAPARDP